MIQPYTPRPTEEIKAWHLRSHSEAILWLYEQVKNKPRNKTESGFASISLPFTIRVTPTSIIASAGTINGDSHAAETNTTMTDGTWYFRAKVIINDSTGVITSTDVLWATTEAANTSTDFYQTIGTVDIVTGVPDSGTIVQNTYGPMLTIVYGTPTDKWAVTIY